MNQIEVTAFWYKAIKNTENEEICCNDDMMEKDIYKKLRNISMPKSTVLAVLKQGIKGLDEIHKQAPYYDYSTFSAKSCMMNVEDRFAEGKESLYDIVKQEMDRYGVAGVTDIINRRCVHRTMEFLLENDKEWVKQWGKDNKPHSVKKEVKNDNVNHPSHYASQGEIECIDFITAVVTPYQGVVAGDLQNVVKYTWRCHHKNGLEDLKKAQWYANHAIKIINSQINDIDKTRYKRAMSTIDGYEQTAEEHELTLKAVKQVEKNLKPIEASKYELVIATILNGDLYRDSRNREVLQTALKEWIQEFERINVKGTLKQSPVNSKETGNSR